MQIYVINLERHKDRLANIKAQSKKLRFEFERVNAIDALKLNDDDIKRHYDREKSKKLGLQPFKNGLIACGLSHMQCWKRIAENRKPACVLEDDAVILDENFAEILEEIQKTIKPNEVILLTGTDPLLHLRLFREKLEKTSHEMVRVNHQTKDGAGYVMGHQAAEKLLKIYYPIYFPNDWWYVKKGGFINQITTKAVIPPLIEQDFIQFGSETGTRDNNKTPSKNRPSLFKIFRHRFFKFPKPWF